jgi:hypothetical protein
VIVARRYRRPERWRIHHRGSTYPHDWSICNGPNYPSSSARIQGGVVTLRVASSRRGVAGAVAA